MKFPSFLVRIDGQVFDIGAIVGSNSLPASIVRLGRESKEFVAFSGDELAIFEKCWRFYLDYIIGSRPDPEAEVARRHQEIASFIAEPFVAESAK